MSLYTLELFLHVSGAIGVFTGLGIWLFGLSALRLARDLHDLLGHSLSLITLKSELAGRLVAKESTRAAQEIREIELAARQTLREVREAVAGYRQPRLLSELDSARQLLQAAGIECSIEQAAGELPPSIDAVLAWTVREGVTNVIRHSKARRCFIWLTRENGTVHAEIINAVAICGGQWRAAPPGSYSRMLRQPS